MSAAPETAEATPAAAVLIDSLLLIDFTVGGNSAPYLTPSWGAPEARLAWALGPRSGLRLPAPWDGRPRVLELDVNPCRYLPHVTAQTLSVTINGRWFGTHPLRQRTVLRCEVPPELWEGRDTIEVRFDHPHFFIPHRLRQSADRRPLAISFFSARLYSRHAARPTVSLPELPAALVEPLVLTGQAPPARLPPVSPAPPAAVYDFGVRRPGSDLAREGFAPPEPNFQWTEATFARLDVPAPAGPGPHLLRLTCAAFTHAPSLPAQDVSVTIDGRLLAHLTLAQKATVLLPLPEDGTERAETLRIGLHLPTATRPSDIGAATDQRRLGIALHSLAVEPLPAPLAGWAGRRVDEADPSPEAPAVADRFRDVADADLPAAVQAALGLTPAALLRDFESLGENCEFGIAQRKYDLEVLGLFRFGFTPLASLLHGFADEFRAVADPDAVSVAASEGKNPEFIIAVDAYRMRWHTFADARQGDAETVRRGHATKLAFVRRKFLESVRASRKIFVLKREAPLALAEVLPVLQAINRTGRNILMYVVPGAPPERHGMVECLGPGLLRGHIGAFAPYDDVMSVAAPDWLRLCANAWTLREAAALADDAPEPPPPEPPPTQAPPVETVLADRFCAPSAEDLPALVISGLSLTPAELLRGFESLGENCEFGIAQRKMDCEVLGLFRFGYTDLPALLRGFADDFRAMAEPDAVTVAVGEGGRPEYLLCIDAYRMRWHTFVHTDQAEAEPTRRQQATKLGFLRRKFLEGLAASRKIFVVKRERALTEAEVLPLWEALNRHGRNTLLYVVPGAPPGRVGAVEMLRPGLLRGHIGTFAPNADVMAATVAEDWLRLCANAWTLHVQPDEAAPAGGPAPAEQRAPEPEPAPRLPPPATMLRQCESLGDGAAFGLAQRRFGVDVFGLFRFAETSLDGLLTAFAEDFEAIGDPAALTCSVGGGTRPEHLLSLPRYGMRWATQVFVDEADAEATRRRQAMKLGYLRRKFLETLGGPPRLFVFRGDTTPPDEAVARLAEAVRRHGRHVLLHAVAVDGAPGRVARVAPGLLRGDLAAPGDDAGGDAWVRLIGDAWPLYEADAAAAAGTGQ